MANDNTLRVRYTTGKTLYVQIEAPDGTVWNGTSYVALTTASWTTFATAMSESPSGSGRYSGNFPTSSASGNYSWTIYLQAGGSPATTDTVIASGTSYWSGSTFGGAQATLPSTPPTGYGNLSGNGTIVVTQDYGGTGNLSAIDANGIGIGGATVTAFLTSDYNTNGRNATPKAQVTTTASGQWQTAMLLAAGQYTMLFSDRGYLSNPVVITVA